MIVEQNSTSAPAEQPVNHAANVTEEQQLQLHEQAPEKAGSSVSQLHV